jgi:hypothetical protein
LCNAKFFRCARDMTLGKQHAQRDEEVEIEAANIHGLYDSHNRGAMAEEHPPTPFLPHRGMAPAFKFER